MKRNGEYIQRFPEWSGRIVTPVRVTDIGREHSFEGSALWDTGAEGSVMSRCVAEACRLQDFVSGASIRDMTEEKNAVVGVVLVFPGDVRKFVPLHVAVLDDLNRDVDVIIGMDLICRGDFSLTRKDGMLEMRFVFGEKFMNA